MKITKVELWMNSCYSCHSKEYLPLHDWFLSLGLPLRNFESIRVPLKKEWQNFTKEMAERHIELPFVVIHTDDGDKYVYQYTEFIKNLERSKEVNLTKEQLIEMRNKILVKPTPAEEKEEAVKVVSMKKKTSRKKTANVKKEKTATTAVE